MAPPADEEDDDRIVESILRTIYAEEHDDLVYVIKKVIECLYQLNDLGRVNDQLTVLEALRDHLMMMSHVDDAVGKRREGLIRQFIDLLYKSEDKDVLEKLIQVMRCLCLRLVQSDDVIAILTSLYAEPTRRKELLKLLLDVFQINDAPNNTFYLRGEHAGEFGVVHGRPSSSTRSCRDHWAPNLGVSSQSVHIFGWNAIYR